MYCWLVCLLDGKETESRAAMAALHVKHMSPTHDTDDSSLFLITDPLTWRPMWVMPRSRKGLHIHHRLDSLVRKSCW